MTEKREIRGDTYDGNVRVKLTGGRYTFIAFTCFVMMFSLGGIHYENVKSNSLKEQELKIRRAELDLAKRQYTLDSLRYFAPQKIK